MDKNEIIALLNFVGTPIYQIEANLGMPKTTLQKAIKGQRVLPKKWAIKLQQQYGSLEVSKKGKVAIQDLTNPQIIEPVKQPTSNYAINTLPKEIDFGEDIFLQVEKYTAYPTKSAPKEKAALIEWMAKKKVADAEVRTAWQIHKSKPQ